MWRNEWSAAPGLTQGGHTRQAGLITGKAADGKGREDAALKTKDGFLVGLEDEKGNQFLPGGGNPGLEEDAVAMEDELAGSGEGFEVGITPGDEVFEQEVEDGDEETGVAELAVELLTAAEGVGIGQGRPSGGGGELPEDAIQQEAVGVGDGAGAAFEKGILFPVEAFKEGLEQAPVAVVEEGGRGGGQTAVGGEGRPHP